MNVIALAQIVRTTKPESVARLFLTLDKTLKMTGDKRLVLKVAQLSVEAARHTERNRSEVEGEVQAEICGIAWVYQRIGRLEEARVHAERSLQLGKEIGWDRNTAFCMKCIGRLYRMESEAATDKAARENFLKKSVGMLTDAIRLFSDMKAEFGPESAEVGDCFSLLSRTHLVAGRLSEARQCARHAIDRIPETELKDYSDLQILLGDIEVGHGQTESAIHFYIGVIDSLNTDTPENSEILARAFSRRAAAHKALGKKPFAARDYKRAAEIWQDLHEDELSAEAAWHVLVLEEDLPRRFLKRFDKEQFLTRLIAVELLKQEMGQSRKASLGRRPEPTDAYLNDLAKRANQQAALERIPWS